MALPVEMKSCFSSGREKVSQNIFMMRASSSRHRRRDGWEPRWDARGMTGSTSSLPRQGGRGSVTHVEVEACVEEGPGGGRHELHHDILARADDGVRETAHPAEGADGGRLVILAVVHADVVVGAVGAEGPHGAHHGVLAALAVHIELLILDIQLDEGHARVEIVLAVQVARVHTRVARRLHEARLELAVREHPLAIRPGHHLSTPERLNAGVEAEVGLLCKVVDVEDYFDEGSLGDEGPGLLDLATEHAQILPVRYIRLCVAVHDLRRSPRPRKSGLVMRARKPRVTAALDSS
ncbi:hypothetical protein E2C01_000786 [Portunus trituberculatus]|uniref:Uncharacterized protein n=1 Tax=Portunus trituberculatus TaxID=210409 RepID=A0A5B7CG01_PORTR|nr:hypothetical protein [Portunus trituberculatus]